MEGAPERGEPSRVTVVRQFDGGCALPTALRLLGEIAADNSVLHPVAPRQPLALYGAGNLGRLARGHLRAVGADFQLVVDRNADALAGDPAWQGIPVSHPDAVDPGVRATTMLAVSIATSPYVPLEMALRGAGWGQVVPFYDIAESFRDQHPLSNGWYAAPFDAREISAIETVLEAWDDDVSRAHHLQFVAWRRLRQEWTFADAPITLDDRFFIPEVLGSLGDDEVLVDAGAHHGSVTKRFIEETRGRYRDIFAIEPDAGNRGVMSRMLESLPRCQEARITIFDTVLDSEKRTACFHDGLGYASQIAPTGGEVRQTATLDSLSLPASFIKLHLEGAELAVLRGSVETIRRHRPIVAATVYHNADGLFATAKWLMDNLEDYRLLFRLHSWCGTGAVIYALPLERGS